MTAADRCPLGIDPEDVAAWASGAVDDDDLAAHVEVCPACSAAAAQARAASALTAVLRTSSDTAPATVSLSAVARIRIERRVQLVAETMVTAAARVARAVPAYLHISGTAGSVPPPPPADQGGDLP